MAKCELQVVIDFLKTDLAAKNVLVQVARNPVVAVTVIVERFPDAAVAGPQYRLGAGVRRAFVHAVNRDIRKQRGIRRHAAGSQPARGRGKQPVIRTRNDADEERRHPVDITDHVISFTSEFEELASHCTIAESVAVR